MWLTNKQKSANYEAGTVYHKEIILTFTTFACTLINIYIANIITNEIIIIITIIIIVIIIISITIIHTIIISVIIILIMIIIFIIIILNNSLSGKIR